MPRTSLVAPKGAQRSLQNSKFRQKHENPYIRQFSLFSQGTEPTFWLISQKIFRNQKIWEHFFLLLFYPLQLCHWTFSLKINIEELFLFFFFFFFAFEIVFFRGLEKVYLVRRWISKTINSVNIGRIYTKK